jgi:threonine/homoserine/homoserine lactone efflux protein
MIGAYFPLIGFAFSQVATPGPANMAMLSVGARYGFFTALPFMFGVLLGKQFIIWPIGFGLMELQDQVPWLFLALKYISAAYIIWLAWRVANMRLDVKREAQDVPGFRAGLWVHPLNPKAWALITGCFTSFVPSDMSRLEGTFTVALTLFLVQLVCHPIWTFFGDRIASTIIGTHYERYLMWTLAFLTVAFVAKALV